jgi:hypothetical protein
MLWFWWKLDKAEQSATPNIADFTNAGKELKIRSLQLLNWPIPDVITSSVGSLIKKLCTMWTYLLTEPRVPEQANVKIMPQNFVRDIQPYLYYSVDPDIICFWGNKINTLRSDLWYLGTVEEYKMAHHRHNEDRIDHQGIAVITKTMKDKQDR